MARIPRIIVLTLALSPLLGADEWLQLRSPNFTLIGNCKEKQAREILENFEIIRRVIQGALPGLNQDPGQPVLIFAVKDEKTMRQLLPQYWEDKKGVKPAGIFTRTPERHFVVMRADNNKAYHTVFHEYFHLLLDLNTSGVPLWVNEGLAEFYGNTRIRRKDILLGTPDQGHLTRLQQTRLVPLDVLFRADHSSALYREQDKASIFYSQSWALVHFLMMSSTPEKNLLSQFVQAPPAQTDAIEVARSLFGSLDELEKKLSRYLRQRSFKAFKYPEQIKIDVDEFDMQALDLSTAAALQASLLVATGRHVEARAKIQEALALDPDQALAHESAGFLHHREGNLDEALNSFREAVQRDSESYLSQYYFAEIASRQNAGFDLTPEIEASLRRAIQLRPTFPPAHSLLGSLLLQTEGREAEGLASLRQALRLEPGNHLYLQQLGLAYLRAEDVERAQEVANRMSRTARSDSEQLAVDSLQENIDRFRAYLVEKIRYEKELARYQEGRASLEEQTSSANPSGGEGEAVEIPRRVPREIEDQVTRAEGDDVIEGQVTSVNCAPPATLSLVISAGGRVLNLSAPDFTKLRFFFYGSPPPNNFDLCSDLENMSGTFHYREGGNGSLELIKLLLSPAQKR